MPFCSACSIKVQKNKWVGHLRSTKHKNNSIAAITDGIIELSSAFKGRISSYRVFGSDELEFAIPELFLDTLTSKLENIIKKSLIKHVCLKINFEYFGNFLLFKDNKEETKSFTTKNFTVHQNYKFSELYQKVINDLKKRIEEFEERDSGWAFLSNLYLEINVNKYQPLKGSSYIDLPMAIKNKKACINIQNKDDYCFLWSIVAALYPSKKHKDRTTSYPHFKDVLNIDDLSFPMTFSDICTFERNNVDLSINVYSLMNNRSIVGPIYRSQHKRSKNINLLLIENGNKSHYVLINNLSRLVRSQITKHHGKLYFCEDCLIFFATEHGFESHICSGIATVLPDKGTYLQFKNFERHHNVPFVVYADFETILKPFQTCEQPLTESFTSNKQIHIPVAFAYYVVCSYDESLNRFVQYRGPDCASKFLHYLYKHVSEIYEILNNKVPMTFTKENALDYKHANMCYICKKFLFFDKVRDHCHLTGLYRGAAHQYCNLRLHVPKFIPVFFHNLSGYDSHLFIKELGKCSGPVKIIPKNKENYISFTKFLKMSDDQYVRIRFVDSFKFLGTSLEN